MAMKRAVSSASSLTAPLRPRLPLPPLPPPPPPPPPPPLFSTLSNSHKTSDHLNSITPRLFSLLKTKTLTSFEAPSYDCNFYPNVYRCVSYASSSPRVIEMEEQQLRDFKIGDGYKRAELDGESKDCIPVKAFFFSTSVDLKSLVEQNKANFIPPISRMTNYAVFKFGGESMPGAKGITASLRDSECTYMVVYQYGSIVLFNAHNHKVDEYLEIVRKHASGWLPEMRKDEYEVKEKPTLDTWMQGGLDHILLQQLDVDGIRTIGSVLGQSIALDYYVRQVDGMVAEFTDINRDMEKTGTFTMQRRKLFQLVGKANSNLADVILKLGLFERSDIAWKNAKYAQIWEYLRDEFELTPRFASLDFKLKFVEHNIRFLQEILQNRRTDFLEWVIIILISVEILISMYGLINDALEKNAPSLSEQPIDLKEQNESELGEKASPQQLTDPTVHRGSELENKPSAVLSADATSSIKTLEGNSSISDQQLKDASEHDLYTPQDDMTGKEGDQASNKSDQVSKKTESSKSESAPIKEP